MYASKAAKKKIVGIHRLLELGTWNFITHPLYSINSRLDLMFLTPLFSVAIPFEPPQ
jgi:hypothetical protein